MTALDATAQPTPCSSCAEPVVVAEMLSGPPGRKDRHEIAVDPAPMLPADGLLLHLGRSSDTGRWLLLPLDDRAAESVRRGMRLPHAHRQHVCAVVPTTWPAAVVDRDLVAT